jgi:hypothetical protein
MQIFHPENIPATISAFRPDGEVPVLNERYIDGGECHIFKVDFSDGESWSVRIPIHVQSDSQDAIISVLRGEQDVLQEIGATDFPWAPKHHGSSFTFENLVGYPFIVLLWIEGSPFSGLPTTHQGLFGIKSLVKSLRYRCLSLSAPKKIVYSATFLQVQMLTFIVGESATVYFENNR